MTDAEKKILQKGFNCPVCFEDFTSPRARMSKIRLYNTDHDLRPYYEGLDVVCYEIITCPHCGYSAIEKTFMNVTDAVRDNILEVMSKTYKKREWPHVLDVQTAIERFVLALICASPKKAKSSEYAYLYLKLSWLYRVHEGNEKREENEIFCQKKFVELAEQTFADEHFPVLGFEESIFLYLIGEVSRRLKDYERATKYIGRVLLDKNATDKLRERAYDVKELILQERREIAKNEGSEFVE